MEVSPVLKVSPGLCSSHVEMPGWRLQEAAREVWGLVRAAQDHSGPACARVWGASLSQGCPGSPCTAPASPQGGDGGGGG